MSKMKTKKAALKRFRLTKTGKIMRGRQYGRHLRSVKSSAQKRRYRVPARVPKGMVKTIMILLGKG